MTSEYVQRLAEWIDKDRRVFHQPAEPLARSLLTASGATARIEELERDLKYESKWAEEYALKLIEAEKRVEELEKVLVDADSALSWCVARHSADEETKKAADAVRRITDPR